MITSLTMASVVAGVTEEAAFRGYMQTRIERQYGLLIAILVNGVMFGLLHFPNHPIRSCLQSRCTSAATSGR
jgi:membrane protease YdiL (CAAX protease family)